MAGDPYKYFRVEARDLADQLGQGMLALERGQGDKETVGRLLRLAHTLKGAARIVRQPEIAEHAHAIEDVLAPFRDRAEAIPSDGIERMFRLVDGIARRVAALNPPPADASSGESPVTTQPAAGIDPLHGIRTDAREIDGLIDGIGEVYSQVASLSRLESLAESASRIAGQMAEAMALGSHAPGAVRNRAAATAEDLRQPLEKIRRNLGTARERLERELRQVRDAAEQLRLVPAGSLFGAIERTARDASRALGKPIGFRGSGADIRLDAGVARSVQEALSQIVRNAVAHGIEEPGARRAAGKPEAGTIGLDVIRRGRRILFRCTDDGRGIDLDGVRRAAARKGVTPGELQGLDAQGLARVLLQGGISTAAKVTEVSGRGIGMDIIREAVKALGGDVAVETTAGVGTVFSLSVPVSVASIDALSVVSGDVTAMIPLDAVRRTVRLDARDIYATSLGEAVVEDGHATPFLPLEQALRRRSAVRTGAVSAVVVKGAAGTAVIGVDRILGNSAAVWRALPELAPADAVVAGASLDASGSPILLIDADALAMAAHAARPNEPDVVKEQKPLLVVDDSLTTRMLEQSILESAGYEVHLANSAEQALEQVRRVDYGLILVDVEMPGMDGFGFIATIRRDPDLRSIPAILVTSRNAPEDRRRGDEVGANGYVVKSEFDQAWLLSRIRQLVR
jgi:two-component system chemotaxis sensor kinase CheA